MADDAKPDDQPPLYLDLDVFWAEAALYQDWDYQFSGPYIHPHNPAAEPGYPAAVLERSRALQASTGRSDFSLQTGRGFLDPKCDADATREKDKFQRRYINCCMFVEAAAIGTATRMPWAADLAWPMRRHQTVMFQFADTYPPAAYVTARLATPLLGHEKLDALEPKTIYVCQTEGHSFFIIDYDPASDRYLTLEAAPLPEFRLGPDWYGGVGHRGVGRVGTRHPENWASSTREGGPPKWREKRDHIKAMAVLHVRDRYVPATTLPFDPPGRAPSPWASAYHAAERRPGGGYFPLGLQRNLHGGVHLPLAAGTKEPQPVRALAAGEVVAARFGKTRSDAGLELAGNFNGLVLVRHRIKPEAPGAQPLFVYTLYLHLLPLDDLKGASIPWIDRLDRQRAGAAIQVDPDAEGFRTRHWAAEPGKGLVAADQTLAVRPAKGPPSASAKVPLRGPKERVGAVRRPADADVVQARAALDDAANVATFALPFVPVEAGEVIGFVGAIPKTAHQDADPGFLHWEVFAPVPASGPSALEQLVSLAEEKLGLSGVFRAVTEQGTPNNVIDVGSGELSALLAALPDADRQRAGGAPLLRDLYEGADLEGLLADPKRLEFADVVAGAKPPGDPGFDYPVRVEVENHLATLPTAALAVDVRTDAGTVSVSLDPVATGWASVVRLPAGARVLSVDAADAVFDAVGRGTVDTKLRDEQERAHVGRLVTRRWRNVRLRLPNEWSVEGLMRSLEPRLEVDAKTRRTLAEAVAWWNHAEKRTVGKDGKERSLFGPAADQLPLASDAPLDVLHPVTFAWVLDLLVAHGAASIVATGVTGTPEARRPVFVGWLPALMSGESPVRAVGEPLFAAAIAAGEVAGGPPVVLEAVQGGRRAPVGEAPWAQGLVTAEVTRPLWGTWTLEAKVDGAAAAGATPIGSTTLTARAPVLASAIVKAPAWSAKAGRYTWSLEFTAGLPRRLRGWAFFVTQRTTSATPPDDADWASAPRAAPAIPFELTPAGGPPTIEGGYYVDGPPDVAVSAHFTWGEWCKAAGARRARVAVTLTRAVEAIRMKCARLELGDVDADGLGVSLVGALPVLERAATAAAKALEEQGARTASDPATNLFRVTVAAPPAEDPSGTLVGEFAPQDALRELLKHEQLGPKEFLHVRLGAVFANGFGPGDATWETPSWAELDALAPADRLEVRADAVSRTLGQPRIGAVTARLSPAGLVLTAPLEGGDAAYWKAAKARFEVTGGEAPKRFGEPDRAGTKLGAVVPIHDAAWSKRTLTIMAVCDTVLFREAPVEVAPAPLGAPFDTTPRADVPEVTDAGDDVLVTVTFPVWRTDRHEVEVRVRPGPAASPSKALALKVRYQLRGKTHGRCDADGVLVARIAWKAILAAAPDLEPERPDGLLVEVVPGAKAPPFDPKSAPLPARGGA